MPVRTKAKDQSEYMRTISHHNLKLPHHHFHPNNAMKVLIFCGIILAIALIIISLAIES